MKGQSLPFYKHNPLISGKLEVENKKEQIPIIDHRGAALSESFLLVVDLKAKMTAREQCDTST